MNEDEKNPENNEVQKSPLEKAEELLQKIEEKEKNLQAQSERLEKNMADSLVSGRAFLTKTQTPEEISQEKAKRLADEIVSAFR